MDHITRRACATCALALAALTLTAPATADDEAPPKTARPDYLSFMRGAVPLDVRGPGAALGAGLERAVQLIDGEPGLFSLYRKFATDETWVELVYALPAPTTFDRFAVPEVHETPSPTQSFIREVTVQGSATSATEGLQTLASGTLAVHAARGEVSELKVQARVPVRYVVVRLSGAIDPSAKFHEMTELIGNGTQAPMADVDHFTGAWQPPGGVIRLTQRGPAVTGCLDNGRKTLSGTVTGALLQATFKDNRSSVQGALIASLSPTGELWALRSDNGAPFRVYRGERTKKPSPPCAKPATPPLGCGATVHGLQFRFDSAELLPASKPILDQVYEALRAERKARILIEGHSSREGSADYNQALSERRAAAVVAALVARGIPKARLASAGRGETQPLTRGQTEADRAINRRVEIECTGPAAK